MWIYLIMHFVPLRNWNTSPLLFPQMLWILIYAAQACQLLSFKWLIKKVNPYNLISSYGFCNNPYIRFYKDIPTATNSLVCYANKKTHTIEPHFAASAANINDNKRQLLLAKSRQLLRKYSKLPAYRIPGGINITKVATIMEDRVASSTAVTTTSIYVPISIHSIIQAMQAHVASIFHNW